MENCILLHFLFLFFYCISHHFISMGGKSAERRRRKWKDRNCSIKSSLSHETKKAALAQRINHEIANNFTIFVNGGCKKNGRRIEISVIVGFFFVDARRMEMAKMYWGRMENFALIVGLEQFWLSCLWRCKSCVQVLIVTWSVDRWREKNCPVTISVVPADNALSSCRSVFLHT